MNEEKDLDEIVLLAQIARKEFQEDWPLLARIFTMCIILQGTPYWPVLDQIQHQLEQYIKTEGKDKFPKELWAEFLDNPRG